MLRRCSFHGVSFVSEDAADELGLPPPACFEPQRLALLFAKGLTLLTLRYPEQWAEGEAILGRITSEGVEATLDRLVGAPFFMSERKTITDDDELLLRQVNPSWLREGRVSSQAFRPMPKDDGLLSVDRGSLATPESSLRCSPRASDSSPQERGP